jgi:hypothetical protein
MSWQSKSNGDLIESEIGNNPWIPINYSQLLSDITIEEASVLGALVGERDALVGERDAFVNSPLRTLTLEFLGMFRRK